MEGKKDRGTEGVTPAIDALIGDEEQNEKQEEKERNRAWVLNLVPLEPSVATYVWSRVRFSSGVDTKTFEVVRDFLTALVSSGLSGL